MRTLLDRNNFSCNFNGQVTAYYQKALLKVLSTGSVTIRNTGGSEMCTLHPIYVVVFILIESKFIIL